MINKNDSEIIKAYLYNVFSIYGLQQQMIWNAKHCLPSSKQSEEIEYLKQKLLRFEDIINSIHDRQTRNIIRCHFVLGMTNRQTANALNIHPNSVVIKLNQVLNE